MAFRLPALVNAAGTNSDAAVVGLQARDLLAGRPEAFSPFLYGSPYQTSVDTLWVAFVFLFTGPTALGLTLAPLLLHVALTLLAFGVLRRHLSPRWALALCALLVFTAAPVHTYVLYPPRQASLTLAFLSLFLLDGAQGARRPRLWAFSGGVTATLAMAADPYALVFLPALLVFGLARAKGKEAAVTTLAGALVGLVPFGLLTLHPASDHGPSGLAFRLVPHNRALLLADALPWISGLRVYAARHVFDFGPVVDLPWVVRALGVLGASGGLVLLLAMLASVVPLRRTAWRRSPAPLAAFGVLVVVVTIAGFLTSVMVMDLFAARYLVAVSLALPVALAPSALRWPRLTAAALVPYAVATGLSGWLAFGDYVNGALPARSPYTRGDDERALTAALGARGVTCAVADYWASYRLTFVTAEALAVVPLHPRENRIPRLRALFEGARRAGRWAYVHDEVRSRESYDEQSRAYCTGALRCEEGAAGVFRYVVVTSEADADRAPR